MEFKDENQLEWLIRTNQNADHNSTFHSSYKLKLKMNLIEGHTPSYMTDCYCSVKTQNIFLKKKKERER